MKYKSVTKQPKGAALFEILIVAIFTIIAGPIIGAGIACAIGLICGGGDGGGGAPSQVQVTIGNPCTSTANACGMTNTGFYVDNGDGTASCNATTPSTNMCASPSIPQGTGFYANPSIVGPNSASTLHWQTTDSTSCVIRGDNGFTNVGDSSGSVSTGILTQTTTFTITCENGPGGPTTSSSIRVIFDPRYQEI